MADNIAPDEIKRRLIIFLRIPNEVWTDVLKMLPRRALVQNISPACYRLKEIANKNVKCVHVITNANRFSEKLDANDPEASQQLAHLAGHNCPLANQIRLAQKFHMFGRNSAAIPRHCIDLFLGCKLSLKLKEHERVAFIEECLTRLAAVKPSALALKISLLRAQDPQLMDQLLRHKTIWNSTRIRIMLKQSFLSIELMAPIAVSVFDWLHYQPTTRMDESSGAGADQPIIRCMIFQCKYWRGQEVIDWIITRCIQNFQGSQYPGDRRRFVLNFCGLTADQTIRLEQFEGRHRNQKTGEVLLIENASKGGRVPTFSYRLRRCWAEEAAVDGANFYAKMFNKREADGSEEFNVGNGKAEVLIK